MGKAVCLRLKKVVVAAIIQQLKHAKTNNSGGVSNRFMWHMFFLGNTFIYVEELSTKGLRVQEIEVFRVGGISSSSSTFTTCQFSGWYLPSILEAGIPQQEPIENNMR